MGLKITKTFLPIISIDEELRFDFKFYDFFNRNNWNIFNIDKKLISLSDILVLNNKNFIFEDGIDYKGLPTGKSYINEYGVIIGYEVINKENKPNRLKYFAEKDSIVISSLRLARSSAFLVEDNEDEYVYSNGFYIFKVKHGWNKKFIEHLLRMRVVKNLLDTNLYRGIGISSYKETDFLKLQIPNLDFETQEEAVKKIMPIERDIKHILSSQKSETDIINEVLIEELGFNIEEFNSIKKKGVYTASLFDFSGNIDLRFSSKFHNPSHNYMHNFLIQKTNKRVKDFVSEPIVLGKSVSPSEYDESGECYYMSMATIKSWYFDTSEAKSVSNEYEKSNQNKKVAINDIIIARSGEGSIGKVALIDDVDTNAVFADFTMRVRLKNYNHQFAYYYFRSLFFQHLVEHNKKGLGNNTNIFPSQIQEFPMLDFSLEKQDEIVEKIKKRIDEQQAFRIKIEEKRAEIEKIILETLTF